MSDTPYDNIAAFLTGRLPAIPEDIERQIVTPHAHEGERNKPLWLIWKIQKIGNDGIPCFPQLDTVCDTPESTRYHVAAVLQGSLIQKVWVERIPANHRFASSLDREQMDAHSTLWKARVRRLNGD